MNKVTHFVKENSIVGAEIRKRRRELGLSQEDLAHAADIGQSLLSKVELGKVHYQTTIKRIQDALNSWSDE